MAQLRARLPGAAGGTSGAARTYRPELQGLRAVAAALVVVYHIWLGRVSGGVDVFFLVSGFLVTGQLVRAVERGGIRFGRYWGRMLNRLMPAALTVLLVTTLAGMALLPESRWFQTIREVVASAFYAENWRLVADSADYFTPHHEASVVQHFWSLSIQGQFYLVWPLLVGLVAALAGWAGRQLRRPLAVTLAVVFAASLAYSVALTATDQQTAYFHSLTRAWEFALGGLLALAIDAIVLPRAVRVVLGWLGLAGLVACGLVLQVGSVFPGYLALWPTLSAALVLVAGWTSSPVGVDRLLASRPLEYLGNLSYALYLWHWPVLVLFLTATQRAEVGLRDGALIIGLSLLLSVLTHHLVEQPVRRSRIGAASAWGAYRFALLILTPVLLTAGAWQLVSDERAEVAVLSLDDADHPGARARLPGFEYQGAEDADLTPSYMSLPYDWSLPGEDCVVSARNAELEICATATDGAPTRRVVVVGDSHSRQYLAALRPIAEQRNWQIIGMGRSACPFSTDSDTVPGDQGCIAWNSAAVDEIRELRPDFVFTIATRDVRVGLTEWTPPGYVEQWRKLADDGIPVVAVRDNPRYDFSPAVCAERNGVDAPECATPRAELLAADPPYLGLDNVPDNVSFLDFSDFFCTEEVCPPAIGNVLIYMDDNHVSASYLTTMSSIVDEAISAVLGEPDASY